MNPAAFEAQQREREWFHSLTVPAGMWAVLRVDGRGFSKLTETRFTKPFDTGFRDHMLAAARALVIELGAVYGYTESDEISVVLPPAFGLFGRSLEKLVSVSAGIASAAFTAGFGTAAHFDSRVWIGASLGDVVDYLSWRQADAARCALNGWAYWTLRGEGLTARAATRSLHGAHAHTKLDLLHTRGINFGKLPAWQRRGTALRWVQQDHVGVDPRTGTEVLTQRRRLLIDGNLPIGDAYRAQVTEVLQ